MKRDLHEQAAAAWPFSLSYEQFARFVDARVDASAQGTAHLTDLFLACACLQGVPGALAELNQKLSAECRRVEGRRPGQVVAADLQQELAARLLAGAHPRLADYRGQGPLGAWLAASALRLATNHGRETRRRDEREQQAMAVEPHPIDPELELLRERSRDTFNAVFGLVLSGLDPKERALLRMHLVDGLGIDQLARLQRISRSTAARWLADIRRKLLSETRAHLATKLALGDSTLDALLPLLQRDLEISIGSMLASRRE